MPRKQKFRKLGWFYILALSGIALTIIISQLVIQNYISRQQNDSHIINVAGRQRMLSQKISKAALQIKATVSTEISQQKKEELKGALDAWIASHVGLQQGNEEIGYEIENSEDINKMFEEIEPYHRIIAHGAKQIIKISEQENINVDSLNLHLSSILENEHAYLQIMNAIVFQYDKEAQAKVSRLKNTEITILIISLAIILLELLLIFRPIARNVRNTVEDLVESEQHSIQMASELSRTYEELVRSYQELESTNVKDEEPVVFATIDQNGTFTDFHFAFREFLECEPEDTPSSLQELLSHNQYSNEFISGLIDMINNGKNWNGELKLLNASGDFCWLELFIIPVSDTSSYSDKVHKIIARDITDLKEAKLRSNEINREKIEEKVQEQQYRSVLILEGQEEERQRLGREIHDGIGQMLSALKLSLESITPSSSKHTVKRLKETRELMKSIIQETRRVAFNLTPTSLSDFGIVPAVRKFCQGVDTLSAPTVIFENKTRFVNRLENHVENNIYRIVQEAVNNAIKYAKAKTIKVSFTHELQELSINIEDDGVGFNYRASRTTPGLKGSGLGLFNMKERSAFINGKFELNSEIGVGTTVSIKIPLS